MPEEGDMLTFKCVIIGNNGTGKTTYLKRHLSGEFETEYNRTVATEVYPLVFYTTRGPVRFNVWDTEDQNTFCYYRGTSFIGSHCAIIMFDVTSKATYKSVSNWHKDILSVCGNIALVLCGNKGDMKDESNKGRTIVPRKMRGLKYFEISTKTHYNFEKPFLWFARKLIGDPELEFVTMPALVPPAFQVDALYWLQKEEELGDARKVALPDDSDDW